MLGFDSMLSMVTSYRYELVKYSRPVSSTFAKVSVHELLRPTLPLLSFSWRRCILELQPLRKARRRSNFASLAVFLLDKGGIVDAKDGEKTDTFVERILNLP
jgi:hypothetical protein